MEGLEHFNLTESLEYTSDDNQADKDDPNKGQDPAASGEEGKGGEENKGGIEEKNKGGAEDKGSPAQPATPAAPSTGAPVSDEDLFKLRDEKIKEIEEKKEEKRTDKEKKFLEEFKVVDSPFAGVFKTLSDENLVDIPEDKEYTQDIEGLRTLFTDNIKIGINSYKAKLPQKAQSLLTYLENGGTWEDYEQYLFEEDYADVDITDKTNQINLIEDYYISQGVSKEDAKEKIQLFEENGRLEKEATFAKTYLAKMQKQKKDKFEKDQADLAASNQKKREEKIKTFKAGFENLKDIAGFEVSKKELSELQDYMLVPVDKGKTQFQIDYQDDSNKIALAYLLKKKFNFDKVKKKAATDQAALLRKQLDELSKGVVNKKPGASSVEVPDQGNERLELNIPSFMTYSTQD